MEKTILFVLTLTLMVLTIACSAEPVAVLPTSAPPDIGQIVTPDPALATETDLPSESPDQTTDSAEPTEPGDDQTEAKIIGFRYTYYPQDGDEKNLDITLNEDESALISVNGTEWSIESGLLMMEQLSELIQEHGISRWKTVEAEDDAVYTVVISMNSGDEVIISAPIDRIPENFDIAHSAILRLFDGISVE